MMAVVEATGVVAALAYHLHGHHLLVIYLLRFLSF
jgi:hypothetical protein